MQARSRALAIIILMLLTSPIMAAEPCEREFAAAALAANLSDLSMTTGELRLMNGKEDRLRAHLLLRLA